MLDSLVFAAEAEIRWLDHCEARLRRAALNRASAGAPSVEPVEHTPTTPSAHADTTEGIAR